MEKIKIALRSIGVSMILVISILWMGGCRTESTVDENLVLWTPYNDSAEVVANKEHANKRMRYKLIQSKVLDKNEVFRPLYHEVSQVSEQEYERLKPMILEQEIPKIQAFVQEGKLTYEELVLFYLYRIYKYELDNETTLHTIIALNKDVVDEARNKG